LPGRPAAALVGHARDGRSRVPEAARFAIDMLLDTLSMLETQIKQLNQEITQRARKEEDARRLMTIPGVGATAS
jgi:transposase